MKDDVIGFNQEICCVTDTGPRDNTHMQTARNPSKHTYSQTLTHTHTRMHTRAHNTIPLGNLWPKSSMNPSLLAPAILFSPSLSFWQGIGTSYIHFFFFLSVSILHEQRHKHTRSSTNNELFFLQLSEEKSVLKIQKKIRSVFLSG